MRSRDNLEHNKNYEKHDIAQTKYLKFLPNIAYRQQIIIDNRNKESVEIDQKQ